MTTKIVRFNEKEIYLDDSYEFMERLNKLILEFGFRLKTLGLMSYYTPLSNSGAFIVDVFILEELETMIIDTYLILDKQFGGDK